MLLRTLTFTLIAATLLMTVNSCQKEENTTQLTIRLTDNPYNATEVNVDIKEVQVNMRDDDGGWITLNTNRRVYNLLDLQNGIDTVLAQGIVPTGAVREIRFVLGKQNSITIDSATYPLTIPSGGESGLKIKISKELTSSVDSLLIDFDAALSILQEGTGDYKLRPVLKIK